MKNLKNPEKKLYFKIIFHTLVCALVIFGYIELFTMIDKSESYYQISRDSMINEYNRKINEKDSINNVLKIKQLSLEKNIDSLEKVKTQIVIEYGKKVKTIYDASAADHARWLESVITKLDSIKRK